MHRLRDTSGGATRRRPGPPSTEDQHDLDANRGLVRSQARACRAGVAVVPHAPRVADMLRQPAHQVLGASGGCVERLERRTTVIVRCGSSRWRLPNCIKDPDSCECCRQIDDSSPDSTVIVLRDCFASVHVSHDRVLI